MDGKVRFRAVASGQRLAHIFAAIVATEFRRAGFEAKFECRSNGDCVDLVLDGPGFGGAFRIKAWLLVRAGASPYTGRHISASDHDAGRPATAWLDSPSLIPLAVALPETLDWVILFDGRLAHAADVEPTKYVRKVPLARIHTSGWYAWEDGPADRVGPVMSLLGATPRRFGSLAVFEKAATGLDTGHRSVLVELMDGPFLRPSSDDASGWRA